MIAVRRTEPGEVFVSNSGMLSSMRRPRFWAWTLTLTAALLAVVWVGSMKVAMDVMFSHNLVFFNSGGFVFVRGIPLRIDNPEVKVYVRESWTARWWFASRNDPLPAGGSITVLWRVPLWPFVLLTGVPGVWMLVKTRKHTNPNACPACGYDRTGLPQSGPAPCPECGKRAVPDSV